MNIISYNRTGIWQEMRNTGSLLFVSARGIYSDSNEGVGVYFEGICRFVGMLPEGKIFAYEVYDDESEYRGTFILDLWAKRNNDTELFDI